MKKFLLFTLLMATGSVSQLFAKEPLAENKIVLDTIYANDQKNVALFFPEPIRQGITGASNFVFTYNREKEQYFGLLQAKPGNESNLLVISKNGLVFSYIVKYKKQLARLNYFIPKANNIGNEKPVITEIHTESKPENKVENPKDRYQKICSVLLDREQKIGRIRERKQDIILSVENIVFEKDELYFVIQIENRSSLDYDLNFLNLSVATRKKGKRKSMQKLYQKPLYKYGMPTTIAKNQTAKFVYVVPKFSISNDHRGILELNEKNGERNLELKISHRHINNPN